jgi:3,4-dihydroxy-2-butanone 4-phosphate synthase
VLKRAGHTEAAVDLWLAGGYPGRLAEMEHDGQQRRPQLEAWR